MRFLKIARSNLKLVLTVVLFALCFIVIFPLVDLFPQLRYGASQDFYGGTTFIYELAGESGQTDDDSLRRQAQALQDRLYSVGVTEASVYGQRTQTGSVQLVAKTNVSEADLAVVNLLWQYAGPIEFARGIGDESGKLQYLPVGIDHNDVEGVNITYGADTAGYGLVIDFKDSSRDKLLGLGYGDANTSQDSILLLTANGQPIASQGQYISVNDYSLRLLFISSVLDDNLNILSPFDLASGAQVDNIRPLFQNSRSGALAAKDLVLHGVNTPGLYLVEAIHTSANLGTFVTAARYLLVVALAILVIAALVFRREKYNLAWHVLLLSLPMLAILKLLTYPLSLLTIMQLVIAMAVVIATTSVADGFIAGCKRLLLLLVLLWLTQNTGNRDVITFTELLALGAALNLALMNILHLPAHSLKTLSTAIPLSVRFQKITKHLQRYQLQIIWLLSLVSVVIIFALSAQTSPDFRAGNYLRVDLTTTMTKSELTKVLSEAQVPLDSNQVEELSSSVFSVALTGSTQPDLSEHDLFNSHQYSQRLVTSPINSKLYALVGSVLLTVIFALGFSIFAYKKRSPRQVLMRW